MYFLFSGEGPTDLGYCVGDSNACEAADYVHGPMTIFVDQIVETLDRYSFLDSANYGFVSKTLLVERAKELNANKKVVRLPGKKQRKETSYFYKNARVFARIAIERERTLNDEVVGVLFRDSDGTASADRGIWDDKLRSMISGFRAEGFNRGVPMIPKPKSEAWLICAVKENPYQACGTLEDRSGNDNSPNSLKAELEEILGEPATIEKLNPLVSDRVIDGNRINLMSFRKFHERLVEVIKPPVKARSVLTAKRCIRLRHKENNNEHI